MAEKPKPKQEAYTRERPSQRYVELGKLYEQMHTQGETNLKISAEQTFAGQSLVPHIARIRAELKESGSKTLLDYGAGKGLAYKQKPLSLPSGETAESLQGHWGLDSITCYDPGYEPFSQLPTERFDAVICTDVLEHIPEEDIDWTLTEIFDYAKRFVFLTVAYYPAKKRLPNGENAHVTLRKPEWWQRKIIAAAAGRTGLVYRVIFEGIQDNRRVSSEVREVALTASNG
ncbi:MAG: methyltransferase domain-containing protein [Pseudomonadota bacterium]